ncbi:hypothetical protein [Staphylococcus intermedius]|uniref:Membrane protein n=1 Tax=Staphylococcus intermedius NCTC 11048 TaxID=1141106 RepID=A0A380G6K7_STAIN|nr:hypothetical protein [Staphylococcus intermedius]PCF63802.1 hypothetical protein B5C04_07420 [Staphylococcus intermedius]PCF78517.1 hypothetical protein B4W74_07770 [Staphylococcus intermedius]PCF79490.1 hypothetical protein B4W70_07410 [Staphylococcus intermedius]PCF86773.1 hypothetical protein B4W76_06895 [Staphylococcus intermedius]PCF89852.1 hypothetical protein B4W75_03135 [Staphylococcus intermedius]
MKETTRQHPQFQQQFENQPIHRNPNYGKKRRSWVSFILTLIALVLVAIAAYSMYSETLFKMSFLDENVTFDKLKEIANQLTAQSFIDTSEIEQTLDFVIMGLNIFFILVLVNIIFAILTLVFNRTILKVINWIISIVITLIPIAFLFYINQAAEEVTKKLAPYIGNVDPSTVFSPSNALHNAIIFTAIATVLYFISLFFRNRRPKIHKHL